MGFAMAILSAAIKAVPVNIVKAAELDCAYGIRLFRFITILKVKTTIVVVLANVMFSRTFVHYDQGKGSVLTALLFLSVTLVVIFNIRSIIKSR